MEYHITPEQALRKLSESRDEQSTELLELGSLSVRFYSPHGSDRQEPHTRDEVYVVVSGSGTFRCCNNDIRIGYGDVLTVPARQEHRFVDFTSDFATWVFFYGPEGGEGTPGICSTEELTKIRTA
jgi:mannose-6-phosphate isomerase-like protein (cupin superfamily)